MKRRKGGTSERGGWLQEACMHAGRRVVCLHLHGFLIHGTVCCGFPVMHGCAMSRRCLELC